VTPRIPARAATLVSWGVLILCAVVPISIAHDAPWRAQVIDKQTRQPIEGVGEYLGLGR
jgi:hypothetical protein